VSASAACALWNVNRPAACAATSFSIVSLRNSAVNSRLPGSKYRKKRLFGQIRRHLGAVFHELARRKECKIEQGHLMPDHVHILISIPPKYSVAQVIG
jgi:hypothetical protein